MFDRFNEQAIRSIMLAQEEARRLGWNHVGSEMLLLGIIGSKGITATALQSNSVYLRSARVEVEKIIGRGSEVFKVEMPFTPGAKRVLELSCEKAQDLEHEHIGIEHLLLGILNEPEGTGLRTLENLGVDLDVLRTQVLELIERGAESY